MTSKACLPAPISVRIHSQSHPSILWSTEFPQDRWDLPNPVPVITLGGPEGVILSINVPADCHYLRRYLMLAKMLYDFLMFF